MPGPCAEHVAGWGTAAGGPGGSRSGRGPCLPPRGQGTQAFGRPQLLPGRSQPSAGPQPAGRLPPQGPRAVLTSVFLLTERRGRASWPRGQEARAGTAAGAAGARRSSRRAVPAAASRRSSATNKVSFLNHQRAASSWRRPEPRGDTPAGSGTASPHAGSLPSAEHRPRPRRRCPFKGRWRRPRAAR